LDNYSIVYLPINIGRSLLVVACILYRFSIHTATCTCPFICSKCSDILLLRCVHSYRLFQQLSSYDILSTFLMYERHCGVHSPWHPYINMLPASYSTPVYWSPETMSSLLADICQDARLMMNKMTKDFTRLQDLFRHVEATLGANVVGAFTLNSYRWSWTSVCTRCVYMNSSYDVDNSCGSGNNCIALAPLLDLLNHSANVQVTI